MKGQESAVRQTLFLLFQHCHCLHFCHVCRRTMHDESNTGPIQEPSRQQGRQSPSKAIFVDTRRGQNRPGHDIEHGTENVERGGNPNLLAPSNGLGQKDEYNVRSNQSSQCQTTHKESLLDFGKVMPPMVVIAIVLHHAQDEGGCTNVVSIEKATQSGRQKHQRQAMVINLGFRR